jgi:hypothetical protein
MKPLDLIHMPFINTYSHLSLCLFLVELIYRQDLKKIFNFIAHGLLPQMPEMNERRGGVGLTHVARVRMPQAL